MKAAANPATPFESLVEEIDIGGPSLVRAAAKNFAHVGVVVDTADYGAVTEMLRDGTFGEQARRLLAQKAFRITSAYDAAIASWLADDSPRRIDATLPETGDFPLASTAIVMPVFHEDELIGFTGASAHLLDIGGAYPGLAIDLVDNWSEGNIYRAVKLADKGVWQESLFKHILENTRTPTPNRGDMEAMIAACERAKHRFEDLVERYTPEVVSEAAYRRHVVYS